MGNPKADMGEKIVASISIVLPITRPWRVQTMAEQIDNLRKFDVFTNKQKTLHFELILIVDNIEIPKTTIHRCFKDFQYTLQYSGLPLPSEQNVGVRRQRIANNINRARELTENTDFVLLVEDDTDFEPDFLHNMLVRYKPNTGIISAVQAGRHGLHHIGAWATDDLYNPQMFETVPYRESGFREVDATGFYFALLPTKVFKAYDIPCEPLPVGPDVQYGLELRKQGYSNFLYDDLKCGHVEQNRIVMPTEECMQVRFRKQDDRWKLTK